MDERTLRELIHQTGDEQISERVNLWPGIKEQLTVTPHRRLPRTRKGSSPMAFRKRSAVAAARSRLQPGSITANSSPPIRATRQRPITGPIACAALASPGKRSTSICARCSSIRASARPGSTWPGS